MPARRKSASPKDTTAHLGFEAKLWLCKEPADTFRNDLHPDLRADYVLANPPFNDSDWFRKDGDVRWSRSEAETASHFTSSPNRRKYGVPPKGNANFVWVQHFIHHLAPHGMAGFVLANGSMSSNQSGEGKIRKALIEADLVDYMVALPSNMASVPSMIASTASSFPGLPNSG